MRSSARGTSSPSTIERMAGWVVDQRSSDMAEAHLRQAAVLVLDTIGCGIAGWSEPMARGCVASVLDDVGRPGCHIVGSRLQAGLAGAAFANGVLVRVHDLNDYLIGDAARGVDMGGHPSDNIPVALAAGEITGSSGREVLAAIVVGYEIYARLKAAIDRHGAWDGITASAVVAAAVVGRLKKLDRVRMAHALALAFARCATPAGVRSGHLSAAKSIANAMVVQAGVQAASLAAHGITGPLGLIDEPGGLQRVFERPQAFERLTAPLAGDAGSPPFIMSAHVKAFPCLATGQGIVAAALDMHRRLCGEIDRLATARLMLAGHPTVVRQQRDPGRIDPRSRESADHSFPFLAAVALIDGALGFAQFENDRWHDPRVREVMARLAIGNDPSWTQRVPDAYPCRIEATTTTGETLVTECAYPPGFSRNGIDVDEVTAKFERVTADALSPSARRAIIDAALGLAGAATVVPLAEAMAADIGPPAAAAPAGPTPAA